jgi:hypothetical protein
MVGSDDKAPTTSRRASSKVSSPRCTRQTAGKVSASRAHDLHCRDPDREGEEEEEADQVDGVS